MKEISGNLISNNVLMKVLYINRILCLSLGCMDHQVSKVIVWLNEKVKKPFSKSMCKTSSLKLFADVSQW